MGLSGAATNLYDGTVEVLLDTDDGIAIERYISALESNPRRVQFYGMIESIDSVDYTGAVRGDYRF
jgi:acylphosphatase